MNFQPEKCAACTQTTEYMLALDRGTIDIVKCFAARVSQKGINIIHPKKEMEVPHKEWTYERGVSHGILTSTQIGNLTRARVHGLVARVKGEAGNWCFTNKGAAFLKGAPIMRYAVMDKRTKRLKRYFGGDCLVEDGVHWLANWRGEAVCRHCNGSISRDLVAFVSDFKPDQEYWVGINYSIEAGRVVHDVKQSELFRPQDTHKTDQGRGE